MKSLYGSLESRSPSCGDTNQDASSYQKNEISGRVTTAQVIPPDGGWGWLVAWGGCLNHTLAVSLVPSFILIFSTFFADNHTSSTMVTWIFNMNQFIWHVTSFLSAPLCERFGWRKVLFIGGLILSVSVIISGFVTKSEYLFLTFSIFTGVGQGLCILTSYVVVAHYFDKRKGLATGIVSIGNCLGLFLGPLFVQFLMMQYGRQGSSLILGAVLLHCCVVALLFQPVEWHAKKLGEENQSSVVRIKSSSYQHNEGTETLLDPSYSSKYEPEGQLSKIGHFTEQAEEPLIKMIWSTLIELKWYRVQIIAFSMTLIISSSTNFVLFVPFIMVEKGHSMETISLCLAVAGFCNLVSRIAWTTLSDYIHFSSKYFLIFGSFGLFISITLFTLVSSTDMMFLAMSLFGISAGACLGLLVVVVLEFRGLEFLPSVLGLLALMLAVFFIAFGLIFGAIQDATTIRVAARILALAPMVSFVLWLLMPRAICLDEKRKIREEKDKCVER